jgi:hypothetical protein
VRGGYAASKCCAAPLSCRRRTGRAIPRWLVGRDDRGCGEAMGGLQRRRKGATTAANGRRAQWHSGAVHQRRSAAVGRPPRCSSCWRSSIQGRMAMSEQCARALSPSLDARRAPIPPCASGLTHTAALLCLFLFALRSPHSSAVHSIARTFHTVQIAHTRKLRVTVEGARIRR